MLKKHGMAPAALISLFLALPASTFAQDTGTGEPLLDQLERIVRNDVFEIGVVVQTTGDLVWERDATTPGSNGFGIPVARLKLAGALDFGLDYVLQTDFTLSPALLDARLSYHLVDRLILDAGLFKTPFSAEFLIPVHSTDFINRSQAVSSLRPGRQVGLALRGMTGGSGFAYGLGVFNGNGRRLSGNESNGLMLAARAAGYPGVEDGTMEVGASVAFSDDDRGVFDGDRLLFGADVRREWEHWMLSAEVLWSEFDPVLGAEWNPFGYHITAGYMLDPGRHQVLVRWDAFNLDRGASLADQNYLILGYNFWPSSAFEVQINYLIPTADGAEVSDQQVLVNFQVAF